MTCDICLVSYDTKSEWLANSASFVCKCKECGSNKVCIPCVTLIILRGSKFIAKHGEDAILEVDMDYEPKCPFCRSIMPKFIQKLYGKGTYIYDCLLAIKFYSYQKNEPEADKYRKAYLDNVGVEAPI